MKTSKAKYTFIAQFPTATNPLLTYTPSKPLIYYMNSPKNIPFISPLRGHTGALFLLSAFAYMASITHTQDFQCMLSLQPIQYFVSS